MVENTVYDYLFKVVVVGDPGVGKSSICMGFTKQVFPPPGPIVANIGPELGWRTIEVEGKMIKLQIWDTAGQNYYRGISRIYYRGAHGVFVVNDVTNEHTFSWLESWLNGIKELASEGIPVVVLGNKSDLTEERKVSTERGRMMAEEHGLKFMETSAQTGENVELAFMTLAKDIKHLKDLENKDEGIDSMGVPLVTGDAPTSCCCFR